MSRTTVTLAFEQLAAEGSVQTRPGARATVMERPAGGSSSGPAASSPVKLSAYGRRITELPAPAPRVSGAALADFRHGELAGADFPSLAWKKAVNAAILRRPSRLGYGDAAGAPALRTALQGYLWRSRALRCDPGQIVVVSGSQQGIDLCSRLLLDPGDPVIVEDPCYALAREVFRAAGATIAPVPVDKDGLKTERLPAARLAYVTPSHQFPLGSVLSAPRRRELLAWAKKVGGYVLEDDYDGEYRYDVAPVPALHALDGGEHVLYLGTVSKTLSPGLRLGYVVLPPALAAVFAKAKRLTDRHGSTNEQEALATLLASGAYERHVRQARRKNRERRSVLLACLARQFGNHIHVTGAEAGLHVVVWFRDIPANREKVLIHRAAAAAVGLYEIGPSYNAAGGVSRPDMAGIVLGYASLDLLAIKRGVERLGSVVASMDRSD